MDSEPTTQTRRRGAELESAILAAAWDQLSVDGYEKFTIDAVAQRANTSKHVLYRRWDNREELLRATIQHRGGTAPLPIPDSGELRSDLLAVLVAANSQHGDLAALAHAMQASQAADIGLTPAEIRHALVGDRVSAIEQVVDRAIARGEIDPTRITPRVKTLPFDLFRHEFLMNLAPVPDDVLAEIVDGIFMPLVAFPTRE
ncbi:MAG TPA: TetR/AcrR family transcriptional regulator [Microbacteriaceae bacterium]|jgi:AcrR family transcriptional regulator|nr:TetR/AcrR family transcriptional regulator [Microbacteriaceae bacterium]